MLCEFCNKALRRCKRVDFPNRTIHFACIQKLRKIKWERDLEELRLYLESKNISIV